MAHLRSRRLRAALAVPAGLALTASLGFLPGAASAQAAGQDTPATATADGPVLSYVVNTKANHGTIKAVEKAIAKAGGTVVITHAKIGVIVVHSANPDFAKQMRTVKGVQSAGATRTAALAPASTTESGAPEYVDSAKAQARTAAADGTEPLEADQWDLRAIGADKAAKINPGSRNVTVAVIDTGVDDTHPDLAANFSKSQSANCVGGVADTSEGAWRPYDPASDYHGTHVAGEIAAARNGIGVAGVAPGVKVASIKVSDPKTSLFFPESVVCAFVFAADHGVEITNNSYYIDPWLYNCLDDPDQKAIVDAVNRASLYAQSKGTLHVASAGNSNDDLDSDAIVDDSSPDDTTPAPRTVDPHKCFDIPTQLPGVVTVSRPACRTSSRTTPATDSASSTSRPRAATSTRSRTPRRRTAGSSPPCPTTGTPSCRAPRWPARTWPASRPSSRAPTRGPARRLSRRCSRPRRTTRVARPGCTTPTATVSKTRPAKAPGG